MKYKLLSYAGNDFSFKNERFHLQQSVEHEKDNKTVFGNRVSSRSHGVPSSPPKKKVKKVKGLSIAVISRHFLSQSIFFLCVCVSFYNFFSMQQSEQRVVQVIYIEKVN